MFEFLVGLGVLLCFVVVVVYFFFGIGLTARTLCKPCSCKVRVLLGLYWIPFIIFLSYLIGHVILHPPIF